MPFGRERIGSRLLHQLDGLQMTGSFFATAGEADPQLSQASGLMVSPEPSRPSTSTMSSGVRLAKSQRSGVLEQCRRKVEPQKPTWKTEAIGTSRRCHSADAVPNRDRTAPLDRTAPFRRRRATDRRADDRRGRMSCSASGPISVRHQLRLAQELLERVRAPSEAIRRKLDRADQLSWRAMAKRSVMPAMKSPMVRSCWLRSPPRCHGSREAASGSSR